jgi:1-deoxy-D-xylulose-5-phosphate synthase
MVIMAPKDEDELRHMLKTAVDYERGPVAIRYPRGAGVGVATSGPLHDLPIGRAETLREGDDVAIFAVGAMTLAAERAADALAADGIGATVVNARFVKPLDDERILTLARGCGALVTVEENAVRGGFGAGVLETLAANDVVIPVKTLGVPDRVFEHASQGRLREQAGLTVAGIAAAARAAVANKAGNRDGSVAVGSNLR